MLSPMRRNHTKRTTLVVHESELLPALLARWMEREGFENTVRGRTAAGARLGVSHQAVANWLAGALPPDTRITSIALGMCVDEDAMRAVFSRERAPRHGGEASTVADAPQPTVAGGSP